MNWSSSPSSNVLLLGTTNEKIPNFPCILFKALVISLLRGESKFSLIHNPFFERCNGTLAISSLIVQSLVVLGPPQELIFIFNIIFYYLLIPSKLEVLNSHPINYPFIVFGKCVLTKKLTLKIFKAPDHIYNEYLYTRNTLAYSLGYPLQVSVLSPANESIGRTPNNNIYHAQSNYSFRVKAWKTTSKWKEKTGKGF